MPAMRWPFLLPTLFAFGCQAPVWDQATPAEAGFDPGAIETLVRELRQGEHGIVDHFVLVREGKKLVDERFHPSHDKVFSDPAEAATPAMYDYANRNWHPYKAGTHLHTLQSVTKSVTSIAIGLAIDEGAIPGVDTPVGPYLKGRDVHADPRWSQLRLVDLLTMRSGIEWTQPAGTTGYTAEHPTTLMESSRDWVPFIVKRPMAFDPGTEFQYVDGASVLLGEVLRQATGERVDDYLKQRLFDPLGIDEFYWKITPAGEADTEGGLYLTADELARIGQLFLQDGRWRGVQIVPAKWVKESTTPHVRLADPGDGPGYGYQWWVPRQRDGRTSIYCAQGYGGQFLFVCRDTRTVAVFLGWDLPSPTGGLFESRILKALSPARS